MSSRLSLGLQGWVVSCMVALVSDRQGHWSPRKTPLLDSSPILCL